MLSKSHKGHTLKNRLLIPLAVLSASRLASWSPPPAAAAASKPHRHPRAAATCRSRAAKPVVGVRPTGVTSAGTEPAVSSEDRMPSLQAVAASPSRSTAARSGRAGIGEGRTIAVTVTGVARSGRSCRGRGSGRQQRRRPDRRADRAVGLVGPGRSARHHPGWPRPTSPCRRPRSPARAWPPPAPASGRRPLRPLGNGGTGVNVAIVDAGFGSLQAEIAAGNLPADQIVYTKSLPADPEHAGQQSGQHGSLLQPDGRHRPASTPTPTRTPTTAPRWPRSFTRWRRNAGPLPLLHPVGDPVHPGRRSDRGQHQRGGRQDQGGQQLARLPGRIPWRRLRRPRTPPRARCRPPGEPACCGSSQPATTPRTTGPAPSMRSGPSNDHTSTSTPATATATTSPTRPRSTRAAGDVVLTWDQWPVAKIRVSLQVLEWSYGKDPATDDPDHQLHRCRLQPDQLAAGLRQQPDPLSVSLVNTSIDRPHRRPVPHLLRLRAGLGRPWRGSLRPRLHRRSVPDHLASLASDISGRQAAAGQAACSLTTPATSPYVLAVGAAYAGHTGDNDSRRPGQEERAGTVLLAGPDHRWPGQARSASPYDGVSSNITEVESSQYNPNTGTRAAEHPRLLRHLGSSTARGRRGGTGRGGEPAHGRQPARGLPRVTATTAAAAVSPPDNTSGHGRLHLGAADQTKVVPAQRFPLPPLHPGAADR